MAKYIIKRILAAIPMVLIITVICFALMNLAPYDAIDAMTTPNMSPETVALIKAKYGYDQPVYIQYIRWLDGLINGNFGTNVLSPAMLLKKWDNNVYRWTDLHRIGRRTAGEYAAEHE